MNYKSRRLQSVYVGGIEQSGLSIILQLRHSAVRNVREMSCVAHMCAAAAALD